MKNYIKIIKNIFIPVLLTIMLTGCEQKSDTPSTTGEQTTTQQTTAESSNINQNNEQTLRVGVAAGYPPFEMIENNTIVGFDIDLINAIAQKLNLELTIHDMAFYQLFSSLQNGDIDIIISALSSTPNRESDMDFSIPYYTSSISMLSLAYNNFNGTLTPNLKVGVEKGTIMENWIQNQNKSLNLEISSSISVMNILNDLINKNIDVMLIESAVAANIMNTANIQFKEFKVPNTDTNSFVIAVKKGNPIISQINTILETMQQDNSLNTLKQKWDLQ